MLQPQHCNATDSVVGVAGTGVCVADDAATTAATILRPLFVHLAEQNNSRRYSSGEKKDYGVFRIRIRCSNLGLESHGCVY